MTRRSNAFTLIELLITSAILGIISVAIVATFASGLKVYSKVQNYMGSRPDALLALERIERDLGNTVSSSEIDFIGGRESVSFAALIGEGDLGRILYYTKGRYDTLTREEQSYPRATASKIRKGKGALKKLVPTKNVRFSYYYYDVEDKEYRWKNSWEPEDEGPPLGVRFELVFTEGAKDVTLTRTALIPVAYRGPLVKE